jgi:nucleotide-binding universal stress UspA family protein
MIKNILIPLDGSEHSKAALDYGMWMAEKFSGTLFGQHVIDTISIEGTFFHDISGSLGFEPYLDFSTKMREVLEERGKIILEEFSERCRKRGINHQTFLDMGLIANEICERSKLADLVIIGHRGINEEFSTGLLGTTAKRHAQVPPPRLCLDEAVQTNRAPLLATMAVSERARRWSRQRNFCTVLRLPLTILTVTKEEQKATSILQEAKSYLSSYSIETRYETDRGYPEQRIVDYLVKFDYDLLFIGAYGHRRIIEMVLGSTTEYVLRKSPCPVCLNR